MTNRCNRFLLAWVYSGVCVSHGIENILWSIKLAPGFMKYKPVPTGNINDMITFKWYKEPKNT